MHVAKLRFLPHRTAFTSPHEPRLHLAHPGLAPLRRGAGCVEHLYAAIPASGGPMSKFKSIARGVVRRAVAGRGAERGMARRLAAPAAIALLLLAVPAVAAVVQSSSKQAQSSRTRCFRVRSVHRTTRACLIPGPRGPRGVTAATRPPG